LSDLRLQLLVLAKTIPVNLQVGLLIEIKDKYQ